VLAGALEPTSGTVEARARVGWVPQRPAHYARLSARENLELFARLEGERDAAAAADALLQRFDLPRSSQPSADLSVGNRQRLNIALSLLGAPRILLLDEPTASLDPEQRRRVWDIVGEVRAAGGAVCFATQNLEELEHADRTLALLEGRIAGSTPEEVFG
jgi:ABC-type multidrug transport system ATPase subunit